MPRLSIIVPHLKDDAGLESTLLSILENRNNEIEIIIAHDGSYSDPYELGQDEAILIESQQDAPFSSQINLAIAASCSPFVQILLPNSTVTDLWYTEAMRLMNQSDEVLAVSVPVRCSQTNSVVYGLSGAALPHRRMADKPEATGGLSLCGSVFRKRLFKATNGLMEGCKREVAEVELALLMESFGIEFAIAEHATIQAMPRTANGQEAGYEIGYQCAQLANAYVSLEESDVVLGTWTQRLGHLASGLMNPKTVAERLGWVMGIRSRDYVQTIRNRIEAAESFFAQASQIDPQSALRRAA